MNQGDLGKASMLPDLSWLIGQSVVVQKRDFTWFFSLSGGSTIATESHWRLVMETVVATSEDDAQLFGLASPVNADVAVEELTGSNFVNRFELSHRTGDLSLHFQNGAELQFVTFSGGYEGWRIGHGNQQIICLGGGELASFGGD